MAFCALISSAAATLQASGSPDLVGILASITEPGNAAELGLTQDQLDRLESLIKQHESQALTFSAQIRQLPSAEQKVKKAENIRLVERQGLAFLTDAQRSKAEMWRLQKLGPVALIDPEVAGLMGVSDEQIAKIRNVLEGKSILDREMGRVKAAVEINNRIMAVLDESQKTAWQTLIGKPAASEPNDGGTEIAAEGNQGVAAKPQAQMTGPADGLALNFNATPWSEVLKWLAKEAELSLQADSYPNGTLTYRDPFRRYSVAEAMDVMNGVLLGRGYTLVKKNRILISVDLGSGESAAITKLLVRELSELVLPEDLDKRGNYEIVSCVFSIERSTVEEIEREVNLLIGPTGSVVPLPTAGQIVVCETAGKLRIIRELIAGGTRTKKIEKLSLKYVSADEVLITARPLLGLKDGINTSEDLNISTDTFGNTIFATGSADKLQKLKDITVIIDVQPTSDAVKTAAVEQPRFKSHRLSGSDPTTTMDVLQSTFAGQLNMKLSLDPKTSNILALATDEDHKRIDDIIAELAGQISDFEVIQLKQLDTQAAILTLEKFFGKQSKDASTAKGPIFYGDAATRRIMVKGTKQETEQIKTLLSTVEESSPEAESPLDGILLVPLKGKSAERMLDQIELLMQANKSKNRFRKVLPPSESKKAESNSAEEPVKAMRNTKGEKSASKDRSVKNHYTKFVSSPDGDDVPSAKPAANAQEPAIVLSDEIVIRYGPNGLIITSDNPEALKEFNRLYKIAQGQMANTPAQPAVVVLQHIKALAAADLIKSIIAGEAQTSSGGGGGILGDVASSVLGGGLLGGLFGGGGSSASTSTTVTGESTTGNIVITPDPRLNALWVQANGTDMQMVEDLIELIDVADSGVPNQTRGTPKTIQIQNVAVAEVEVIVKEVFLDRIAQPASAGNAQRQPSPEQILALIGGGGRRGGAGGGNSQSELKEQTMTISSDKKNNILIVVATPTLFAEVESFVKEIDDASEADAADVVVMTMPAEVNSTLMQNALKSAFGASVKTTTGTSTSTSPTTPAAGAGGVNPADFLQQFRNRGMGGGATPGGFGGGAPGGFGGATPGGFGGGRGFGSGGQVGGGGQSGGGQRGQRGSR